MLHPAVVQYHQAQRPEVQALCEILAGEICAALPEAEHKVWHGHPVWFLDGNPVVGYSKLKDSVRLLFWSGQSFDVAGLTPEGKFKAAEARFNTPDAAAPAAQIASPDLALLRQWLAQARDVQWDYKNLVKRKGVLLRLK